MNMYLRIIAGEIIQIKRRKKAGCFFFFHFSPRRVRVHHIFEMLVTLFPSNCFYVKLFNNFGRTGRVLVAFRPRSLQDACRSTSFIFSSVKLSEPLRGGWVAYVNSVAIAPMTIWCCLNEIGLDWTPTFPFTFALLLAIVQFRQDSVFSFCI